MNQAMDVFRSVVEDGQKQYDSSSSHITEARKEIESILFSDTGADVESLRKLLLTNEFPNELFDCDKELRVIVWKLLLDVPCTFDTDLYTAKIASCSETLQDKIRDDAFRTFKGNDHFWSKIEVNRLERVLRAIASDFGYVQGMNVLLGPFAFIMMELDSYYCLRTLIAKHIPGYVQKNLDGVHRGVSLFAQCLCALDPQLHSHLLHRIPDLSIFSLRFVLTLMANAQPLEAVLRLWDVLFAFGVHLNVVFLCAHLMVIRSKLLALTSGFKMLKLIEETPLQCELLIRGTLAMVPFLPPSLFEELVTHPMTL